MMQEGGPSLTVTQSRQGKLESSVESNDYVKEFMIRALKSYLLEGKIVKRDTKFQENEGKDGWP